MARPFRYFLWALLILLMLWGLPTTAQQGAKDGQWRSYAGENGSTGYSPLDQINRDNVKNLQIAWSWKFDNFGAASTEVTPLMVNGVLYFPLSPRRTIIAADAGTGETLWTWRPPQDEREDRRRAHVRARRGVLEQWNARNASSRSLPGFRLVALNAKTGLPIRSFGDNGTVDLFEATGSRFQGRSHRKDRQQFAAGGFQ